MKIDSNLKDRLLSGLCKAQWKKCGVVRRAGVAAPLFSLYSKKSVGIGEIPDLKLFVDWCRKTGMSVIQLLPMNDVGYDFTPYDAQSTFALEPLYLSLESLKGVSVRKYSKDIQALRRKFPTDLPRVDYGLKRAKMELLWTLFQSQSAKLPKAFHTFVQDQGFWVKDYALFKTIKEHQGEKAWETWVPPFKTRDSAALTAFGREHNPRIAFHAWLQWQLFLQFETVKTYARKKGVLLLGDLPFLVSRDSADVWAHQNYFKLDRVSGAPPDLYFANGQRWGMPAYRWETIADNDYDYLIQKLQYAENFYDLFRIDHVVGVFRLWTIPIQEPSETAGSRGAFDPPEESLWEDHGRRILSCMAQGTSMLPCGEDLGTVPACSNKVLEEFGIPGMDVQRWMRDWGKSYDFKNPESYRPLSIAIVSTHDMTSLRGWWEHEAGTVDREHFRQMALQRGKDPNALFSRLFDVPNSRNNRLRWKNDLNEAALLQAVGLKAEEAADFLDLFHSTFDERERFWNYIGFKGLPEKNVTPGLARRILEKASETESLLSIQLLQDWLSLDPRLERYDSWDYRLNTPGTTGDANWTWRAPFSLEELQKLSLNTVIKDLHARTHRQ